MTYTATILGTLRTLGHAVTPTQLYEFLLSQGIAIKRGTVKRLLYRLWRRGKLSKDEHLYFFKQQGDSFNHSWGQKGTNLRGFNHSIENKEDIYLREKRGQKNDLNTINHSNKGYIAKRTCVIFYNNPDKKFRIKDICGILDKSLDKINANYRTVQSAINQFLRKGIIKRVGYGYYKLADKDLALMYLERETPKGPITSLPGTIPLPTLKYTTPRIKGVIVPRDIFQRVINQPPKIDPLLIITSPREGDRARQWKIETEQVKVMIPEKTLKATIYIKGPEWKSDLVELFGGWILMELQGKKWMTEAAINMKELLHFKTMQAKVGNIKVSVDQSIFGDDYDLEYQGEVGDVNTAILHTLIGPAKYADSISELKEHVQYIGKEVIEMKADLMMLKHNNGIQELEKRINDIDNRLSVVGNKLNKLDKKIEVLAGGMVKLIDQTSPPEMVEGVDGYV